MRYTYDLHIHSALSPCADDDMTPASIAGMAMLAGLDIIAVADHNSCLNCRAVIAAAAAAGVLALPAVELTTLEEVHVLCLFKEAGGAERFSGMVRASLPPVVNRKSLWGNQLVMDAEDNVTGEEELLLAAASGIGVYDAQRAAREYGGVAIPAHIDRPSFSLLNNLGFYDAGMNFPVMEISRGCDPGALLLAHPELKGARFIKNSDAHTLTSIYDAEHSLELTSPERLIEELFAGLR